MAPVDIRPPGYIPQGTFSGTIPGEKAIERRRRLADVLAQQGVSTEPVQSPWQALARVAQSAAGAYGNYQAGQMEQQRYKALGEAMRSGMTPEQLYGTGDESLMNYAKFKLEMDQHKVEAARQAEMLRLAQAQNAREEKTTTATLAKPLSPTPYERQTQVEQAKGEAGRAERMRAALAYKEKVARLKSQIGQEEVVGQDANGQPITKFTGNDELFGIVQSDPRYRALGNLTNDFGGYLDTPGTEGRKSQLEAGYGDIEMDVARMNFQGQGAVSERERDLAKKTLGGLANPDAQTAWNILTQQENNADAIIASGGGAPTPPSNAPEITLTRPRGVQHPMQGAPPPQPNVRAGEVPLPRTMGVVDTGNGPPPLPQIMTPADYAALQSGQHFLDPEGNERVKP